MRSSLRNLIYLFVLPVSLLLSNLLASAQAVPRIATSLAESPKVRLQGSVHPALSTSSDLGAVAADLKMEHMLLVLQPSAAQQTELIGLLAAQHDPTSAQYHKWLKPEEFAARFAPAQEDVAQIQTWLTDQGFQVESVARGGLWIKFSGTASQVASAFQTEIHQYTVGGTKRVANASEIALPQALRTVSAGLVSLNNIPRHPMHTAVQTVALNASGHLAPAIRQLDGTLKAEYTVNAAVHYVSPGDMAAIYNTKPLLANNVNGTGVSIAVIGETDVQLSDIETFRSIFNLPANDPEIVTVGADPGFSSSDELESDLDLEYAGALAPNAHIYFVQAGSTNSSAGIDLAAAYAVDNVVAPILTLSYGACEAFLGTSGNAFYNQMWEQAASEGITVFVSAGDSGSAGCNNAAEGYAAVYGLQVSGLASTPYNVAVGGTQFDESVSSDTTYWGTNTTSFSSALGYIPEKVWNESCDIQTDPSGCSVYNGFTMLDAGSGGKSSCLNYTASTGSVLNCSGAYAKPAWQAGPGVPSDNVRDLPDVSLTAAGGHDGYLVCYEGSCQTFYNNGKTVLNTATVVGGTSASSPALAGIMALVEQKNGKYQGIANYTFYQLASAQNTSGCNASQLTDPTTSSACVFHDVTSGTNRVPCAGTTTDCSSKLNGVDGLLTGYDAGTGYDLAAGLGSVDANNLVAAWSMATRQATSTALTTGSTSIIHGAPLQFAVSVKPGTGGGAPTGDVSLQANGQSVGPFTLSSQAYSGTTALLPGGSYSLTAHYAGDGAFASSDSAGVQITVKPESSVLSVKLAYVNTFNSLIAISGPIAFGAPVYITSTVKGSSGNGAPSGSVDVVFDGNDLGTIPLDSTGLAGFFLQNYLNNGTVLPGTHTLALTYSGDSSFSASTAPVTSSFTVNKGTTNTFNIPNATSIDVGQPLQIYLSMLSQTQYVSPTGTMQLYDNGVALGGPLTLATSGVQGSSIGQAEYSTSTLAVGKHVLTSTYSGDSYYNAVTAGTALQHAVTVTVTNPTLVATSTIFQQSAATVSVGQGITYTVTVSPASGHTTVPTGTVSLRNSNPATYSSVIAAATPLVNGTAQIVVPYYKSSVLEIYASYSGDTNYDPSISPVAMTSINTIAPTVTLVPAAAYTAPGQQNTLNLTVTGRPNNSNFSVPSGSVLYYDSLNGGTAQPIVYDPVTLGNGRVGTDTLAVHLALGTHTITAVYSGDTQWSSASATATYTVTQPEYQLSAANGVTPVSTGGNTQIALSVTPILSYTGTVSLSCGSGVPVGVTCAISPGSIVLGSAATAQVALTAPADGAVAMAQPREMPFNGPPAAPILLGCLAVTGLFLRRRKAWIGLFIILLAAGLLSMGCGSASNSQYTVKLISVNGTKAVSGSTVHLRATVAGNVSSNVADGTISFYDGTTGLGVANVSNSEADITLNTLSVGIHSLTAVYQSSPTQTTSSETLMQAITGSAVVQVNAVSGSLARTISLGIQLQ